MMPTRDRDVRFLRFIGLAVSLALNVALTLVALSGAKPKVASQTSTTHRDIVEPFVPNSAEQVAVNAQPAQLDALVWDFKNSPQILRTLHEAGFDRTTLETLAYMLAQGELQPRIQEISAEVKLQPWEPRGRFRRMSAQQRREIAAINEQAHQMAAEAMAHAGVEDSIEWKYFDNPRLKGIPEGKIAALAAVDTKYANSVKMAGAGRTLSETGSQIRSEREIAVRELLGADEYEIYQSYHSPLAKKLQVALIGQDISDEDYLGIYRKLDASPDRNTAGIPGEVELIRSTLGDRSAASYAATHDSSAKQAMRLLRDAGIPESRIVECYLSFRSRKTESYPVLRREIESRLSPDEQRAFAKTPMGQMLGSDF